MASFFSDYLIGKVIDHVFRGSSYSAPSSVAVALLTSSPSASETGATIPEVVNGNGYARQSIVSASGNWTVPSPSSTGNVNTVTFGPFTAPIGTVTAVALVDSQTYGTGNMLFGGDLLVNKTCGVGDVLVFTAGHLTITLS